MKRSQERTAFLLGVGVLLIAGLALLWRPLLALLSDPARLRAWIATFGPLAPLAFMALQMGQILIAPLPGSFINLLGGYLFGPWWGTAYGLLGTMGGATLAASLVRLYGRPLLERIVPEEQLHRWERFAHVDSLLLWLVILIPPTGDIPYFVAGLTPLPIPKLLLAALVSRGPSILLASLVGAGAARLPPQARWLIPVLVLVVAVAGYCLKGRFQALVGRVLNRLVS
ncbi:MAG: TVP38/TMEM64 family protein [Anaerolineae bacterium]